MPLPRLATLPAAALLLLLTACTPAPGGPADSPAEPTTPAPAPDSAEMSHIHGLGIDPADGTLYAGTHHGLFAIPAGGEPTRVGDLDQDFMGFTVVGPNHFVASGHPRHGQDGPSAVGLIESTDAGLTWQTLSLAGEADFHALEAVDGTIFGLNAMSGALMVSDDGRSWQTRSTMRIADFAVDPADTDVMVATSEEGPALSRDGGRTFTLLDGAPLLVFVDWAADGTLAGATPGGAVHVSSDAGETWRARGLLGGAPLALHVEDSGWIYAATADNIWTSSDGGRTFR